MNKTLLVTSLSASLLIGCNGGGGGGSSSSNSGGGNTQWTNQIGMSSGVTPNDILTYDPVKQIIYRVTPSGLGYDICMISSNASSNTSWDCNTIDSQLPSNISLTSKNVATDEQGNVYSFGVGGFNSYLLKYNGNSWSEYQLTGEYLLTAEAPSSISYYNQNVYTVGGNSLVQINLLGQPQQQITIPGISSILDTSFTINNGNLYFINGIDLGDYYSVNISNPQTPIRIWKPISLILAVANQTVYTCGAVITPGSLNPIDEGIYSLPVSSNENTPWTKIGYIGDNQHCKNITAGSDGKVFVLGPTGNLTGDYAVFAKP